MDDCQLQEQDHKTNLLNNQKALLEQVEDYTEILGVTSLRGALEMLNNQRSSWAFRRSEVTRAFQHYDLESPISNPGEVTMIQALRLHLLQPVCQSCMDQTYDDTRWHKVTDRGQPIAIKLTTAANERYGAMLEQALQWWVNKAEKLEFEVLSVRDRSAEDALFDYSEIDGPRRVLGSVSRIRQGDLGQALAYLNIDNAEVWSDFMLLRVLIHEIGHLVGLGHTPLERVHWSDIMYPIYRSLTARAGNWTQEQLHGKYGAPVIA